MAAYEHQFRDKSDTWLTPRWLLAALDAPKNFDLDPCAKLCKHTMAKNHLYTSGLEADWYGCVWLNPPYSDAGVWIKKLYCHGDGIALVFARTDVKWWHVWGKRADRFLFLRNRVSFLNERGVERFCPCGAFSSAFLWR